MTTNKPEIVCWGSFYKGMMQDFGYSQEATEAMAKQDYPGYTLSIEPLIRLSDYEALQAECEKLRKDAARYRWLRLGAHEDSDLDRWEHVGYVCGVSVCTDYGFQQTLDAEALDAAIDAAMEPHK